MPPIRRYIRISPHSLLEVRIFLETPSDAGPRWLLHPTSPALPRVFEAVRPLILPKLREERERTAMTKGKGKKGRSVKDVVEGEGFRCVVFLTEGVGRHEVVVKVRTAREDGGGIGGMKGLEMGMGVGKLGGRSRENAVVIREEDGDGDEDVDLRDIPEAGDEEEDGDSDGVAEVGARKRRRGLQDDEDEDDEFNDYQDDKKKLGFDTRYEGFSIWGKVLCLLIERKGGSGKKSTASDGNESAQKVMQEWISSTQVGAQDEDV